MMAACNGRTAPPPSLTVVGLGLEPGELLKHDALDAFTEQTGIRVDLVPAWGSSSEQLSEMQRLLRRPNDAPDVFVIDVIWPGTLAPDLLDLSDTVKPGAPAYLPALLKNNTVDGRLVALPFYVNVGVLYYRADLLKKYGYAKPPATWDQLESMAARIQHGERAAGNPNFWGYVWQGGAYEGLTCDALEWQQSFGGGRIISSDGAVTVNNPGAVQALEKARAWVGTISPKGVLAYTESDSLAAFRSGNAAFLRHWSGALSAHRIGDTPISGRFGVSLLPAGPHGRGQAMGGFQLAVSRRSPHPREAAQLAAYLAAPAIQLRRGVTAGYLPAIPELYGNRDLLRVLPVTAELAKAGEDAWVARPSTIAADKYAAVSRAYYQTVHNVLSSRIAPSQGMADLEKDLIALTGFRAGSPGR